MLGFQFLMTSIWGILLLFPHLVFQWHVFNRIRKTFWSGDIGIEIRIVTVGWQLKGMRAFINWVCIFYEEKTEIWIYIFMSNFFLNLLIGLLSENTLWNLFWLNDQKSCYWLVCHFLFLSLQNISLKNNT